jgi:serine protease
VPRGASAQEWTVPGEIVVDLKDGEPDASVASLGQRFGLSLVGGSPDLNPARIFVAAVPPAAVDGVLARLRRDSAVEAAEPQRLFRIPEAELAGLTPAAPAPATPSASPSTGWKPNDPRYNEQWNFARINVEKAWDLTRGRGAVVAVIDTGVAYSDKGRGHVGRDFKQTEFVHPVDFVHKDRDPWDDNGHGTHVAGTIAESTDNKEGVAGIAFEAKIMPIKVLAGEGYGRMSDVAAGIRWAADKGANVINMSLGGPFPDAITRSACKYAHDKGVTIVAAAGNSGSEGVSYPAAYKYCVAVSSVGPKGDLAPYSSWGSAVTISAPGGDKSLGDGAGILQNTVYGGEDDYFSFQGTSMATPHVAGVAALVVSRGVKDPAEVRAVLEKSATARGDRKKFGAGELNAAAAAKQAGGAYAEYYGKLWLLAALWGGALLASRARRGRQNTAPLLGALALTLGLYLPDVFVAFAGFESNWNLLGHSALVPAFLVLMEADTRKEARFYALMAFGVALHLLGDLWNGTAPLVGSVTWAAIPWVWTNLLVGLGTFVAGLRKP